MGEIPQTARQAVETENQTLGTTPEWKPPRRADLSFRHANESDLAAIAYTTPLSRWECLDELEAREGRFLSFFCSLNRVGTAGYRGTRCSMGALAAAVKRATCEAASVSTAGRALKGLVAKGYLVRSHGWRRPRSAGHGRTLPEQICTFTLTDKAIAVWSKVKPHTHPPLSKCQGDELKRPELPEEAPSLFTCSSSSESSTELVASVEDEAEPAALASGDRCTTPSARHDEGEPQDPCPPPTTSSSPQHRSTLRSVEPFTLADRKRTLLEFLGRLLKKHGRSGKVGLALAAHELDEGFDLGRTSEVRWGYWLPSWGSLSHRERLYFARSEIIPALLRKPRNGRAGRPAVLRPSVPIHSAFPKRRVSVSASEFTRISDAIDTIAVVPQICESQATRNPLLPNTPEDLPHSISSETDLVNVLGLDPDVAARIAARAGFHSQASSSGPSDSAS